MACGWEKDSLDRTIKISEWSGAVADFYNQNTWEVETKFGLRSSPTKQRAQAQLGLLKMMSQKEKLGRKFPWTDSKEHA